ncbi:hypothetical protein K402DRAFT_211410 [Aulographum hederae CBS 113979]|uniref:Uncharacterized protein n=1 Tax=Aulographum hederae CBS 113979 TaxID=1176131 RepID=A0A6G1GMS7_9PEZI|nr:hypothetical protein K402DRAFT_211410 [Aulographum hederae CBS 113979]
MPPDQSTISSTRVSPTPGFPGHTTTTKPVRCARIAMAPYLPPRLSKKLNACGHTAKALTSDKNEVKQNQATVKTFQDHGSRLSPRACFLRAYLSHADADADEHVPGTQSAPLIRSMCVWSLVPPPSQDCYCSPTTLVCPIIFHLALFYLWPRWWNWKPAEDDATAAVWCRDEQHKPTLTTRALPAKQPRNLPHSYPPHRASPQHQRNLSIIQSSSTDNNVVVLARLAACSVPRQQDAARQAFKSTPR